ncbi:MAG TPA: 50S ribosomal protein L35 [Candidatus Saccharibacteria bacterium]|jgi:large subunit ribosomal protein L35|nr:large subunit ribosomal protein [Patescibacteria group bacterium]HMS31014.1 50S ribosomal protein L35 [Candidatus Saccharibacteria bacterium]
MPKIKTHSGTAKRVKKSASGKLIRERAYTGHMLSKKSASRKRNNARAHGVSSSDFNNVKRALGA